MSLTDIRSELYNLKVDLQTILGRIESVEDRLLERENHYLDISRNKIEQFRREENGTRP